MQRRLVIQPGWAALDSRGWDASRVHVAGPVSHDWLFPRTQALIHHGSIGLCARALRHGVPSLILPQRRDQFFNAHAVLSLKAGAAVLPGRATGEGLVRALSERVLVPGTRRAAARIAAALRRENGLMNACREVEHLLT
jgi:sterol 3beta-glucosyltransferase